MAEEIDYDYSCYVARKIEARRNECFRNGRYAVILGLCDTYCEGGRGFHMDAVGSMAETTTKPVHHAWCIHAGKIVEPTSPEEVLAPDSGIQPIYIPLLVWSSKELRDAMRSGRVNVQYWDPVLTKEEVGEFAVYDPMSEFLLKMREEEEQRKKKSRGTRARGKRG